MKKVLWVGSHRDLISEVIDVDKYEVTCVDFRLPRLSVLLSPKFILASIRAIRAFIYKKSCWLLLSYIYYYDADAVFSFFDFNLSIWSLKRFRPDLYVVVYQIGRRSVEPGQFLNAITTKKSYFSVDEYWCWGSAVKDYLNKRPNIAAKFKEQGSFRSNREKINDTDLSKKNEFVWISQLRPCKDKERFIVYNKPIGFDTFYQAEREVLPILAEILEGKECSLSIMAAGVASLEAEVDFYSEILATDANVFRPHDESVYASLDRFPGSFTINSSLGYEMLGRGKMVGFFDARFLFTGLMNDTFAQPSDIEARGSFWTDTLNHSEINRVVEAVVRPTCAIKKSMDEVVRLMCVRRENEKIIR